MSLHRAKPKGHEKAHNALAFTALCVIGGGAGFVLRRVFDFLVYSYR